MTPKIFTVAEMVAAEKAADASGHSYDEMMEQAGAAVAAAIAERLPARHGRVLVLVGPGNNGGDGLVAGRYLAEAGADVTFYLYRPRTLAEDENFAATVRMGLGHTVAAEDENYDVLHRQLAQCNVVIDSLLGTGVDRPIRGEMAMLLEAAQASLNDHVENSPASLVSSTEIEAAGEDGRPFMVAVDCPSGLNCDSGELDPLALPADLTVTFAGPKRGHFLFPGAAAVGELVVADIGISPELPAVRDLPLSLLTAAAARAMLPERPPAGHKGTFGSVLIAAGSAHYWGAPILSGRAAYRAGAGLVALAIPAAVRPVAAAQLPEATYPPLPAEENLDAASAQALLQQVAGYDALLVGPGLGEADLFVDSLLERPESLPPLVVDADGLNSLARMGGWAQRLPANSILTPHPGEMARLTEEAIADGERIAAARRHAQAWGHVVVLKGAFTVIAAPDGRAALLPFANPLLATAGSGDVLAGAIASLLGQGMAPYDAALLGGYLHGAAGELARAEMGTAGLLAGELADWLPRARRLLTTS